VYFQQASNRNHFAHKTDGRLLRVEVYQAIILDNLFLKHIEVRFQKAAVLSFHLYSHALIYPKTFFGAMLVH
jgi:hypothetical protein